MLYCANGVQLKTSKFPSWRPNYSFALTYLWHDHADWPAQVPHFSVAWNCQLRSVYHWPWRGGVARISLFWMPASPFPPLSCLPNFRTTSDTAECIAKLPCYWLYALTSYVMQGKILIVRCAERLCYINTSENCSTSVTSEVLRRGHLVTWTRDYTQWRNRQSCLQ